MTVDIVKNAESVLADNSMLKEFSELNNMSTEAAKKLLERLLKEPEMSDVANEFIASKERSQDFQGFLAGEEKGYVRGHEAGFAKGAAIGALGAIGAMTLAGITYLARLR